MYEIPRLLPDRSRPGSCAVGQADSLPPPFRRRFGCVQLLGGTGGFACLSGFLQLLPQAAGVRSAPVQQVVIIKVDAATKQGPYKPIFSYFSYFGYDEPNYTYMKYGPKLVGELAALSYVPVYIRAHLRSWKSLSVSGCFTPWSAMASPKWRPGIGRYGTSPISATLLRRLPIACHQIGRCGCVLPGCRAATAALMQADTGPAGQ